MTATPYSPDSGSILTTWAQDLWDLQFVDTVLPDYYPVGGGTNCLHLNNGVDFIGLPSQFHAGEREAIHMGSSPLYGGNRWHDATVEKVHITPFYPDPQSKWGFRGYNLKDAIFRDVVCTGIDQEHMGYFNPEGAISFINWVGNDNGAQLIQLVNREEPTTQHPDGENHPWIANEIIRIEGALSYQHGRSSGRGSFPLTITNIGRKDRACVVEIVKYACYTHWPVEQLESGNWIRARGGLMIESDGLDYYGIRDLTLQDWYLVLDQNAQETMRIGGVENGIIKDGLIIQTNSGRSVEIDKHRASMEDKNLPAKTSGHIEWTNMQGNVDVRIGGAYAGHCTEDMVFENGARIS